MKSQEDKKWSFPEIPDKTARHVYTKKVFYNLWRIGLEFDIGGTIVKQVSEFSGEMAGSKS